MIEYKYNTNAIPWHTLYGKWKTQQTHIWVYSEFFVDINIFFVLNVFLVFYFFSFIFIWFCSCSAFGASSSSRSTVSKNKVSFVLAWPWSDEKHEDDQQYKWKEEPDEGAQPQHEVHRQWQHSRARRRPPAIDSMNTKMEESDDYWNSNSNFVIATIVLQC